eukprot:scaffold75040_cov81-Attheya_sp.AAC.1
MAIQSMKTVTIWDKVSDLHSRRVDMLPSTYDGLVSTGMPGKNQCKQHVSTGVRTTGRQIFSTIT